MFAGTGIESVVLELLKERLSLQHLLELCTQNSSIREQLANILFVIVFGKLIKIFPNFHSWLKIQEKFDCWDYGIVKKMKTNLKR